MRRLLETILFIGLLTGVANLTAQVKGPGFTVVKIGEGVYAALGQDGGPAGSNAGFVIGKDGVAVIDTFTAVQPARDLLAEIRKITNLPIKYVINTHYHLDHVGGNSVFKEVGATIVAHRNVAAWERTENLKFFGANPTPERRALVEGLVLPDKTYTDSLDLKLGDRVLKVRFMPGHTGGDSVVIVPKAGEKRSNIVFGGDLVWQKHLPNLIDATTRTWVETLDKLLADHPGATFISGHGGLASTGDVSDFRNYLVALRKSIQKAQASGMAGDDLVSAVTSELKEAYSGWGFYTNFIKRNITFTDAELKGSKKVPTPAK